MCEIPKGFFPIQDTGVIQGITQASQAISFDKMAGLQQELAKAILTDADVESLSSFIGVDGSNVTLNSGRILINLKPHAAARSRARAKSSAGCKTRRPTSPASRCSCSRCRTCRSTPRSARRNISSRWRTRIWRRCRQWTPKVLERLGKIPDIVDVASDLQPNGRSVDGQYRSRQRRALRHHAGLDRQRALRRLRPAHHLDHLHPVQSISGHPRHRSRR